MIGQAIGAAMQIGGAIFGGVSAAKSAKKVKQSLEQEKRENESWFARKSNEDATQRADAQAMITATRDALSANNKAAAAGAAISGGSDEALAQAKAAGTDALGQATSQIAVAGADRKDAYEQTYLQKASQVNQSLRDNEAAKQAAIASAAKGVGEAAGSVAETLDTAFPKL